jgi:hypothetical protein
MPFATTCAQADVLCEQVHLAHYEGGKRQADFMLGDLFGCRL